MVCFKRSTLSVVGYVFTLLQLCSYLLDVFFYLFHVVEVVKPQV